MNFQTEIKYYQNYLNTLDDLAYSFEKTAEDPYNFLLLYQDFNLQLKKIEIKEIKDKLSMFNFRSMLLRKSNNESNKEIQEIDQNFKDA